MVDNVVSKLLNDIDSDNDFESVSKLHEIMNICFNEKNRVLVGDPDDFHNLSLTLAYEDYFDLACIVLDAGLNIFPYDTDLLADFLVYGIKCERRKDCSKYYEKLIDIPKKAWSWRAYDFSIDYLLALSDYEIVGEQEEKNLVELLNGFKQDFPNDERPYMSEANYFTYLRKHDDAEVTLRQAIEKINVSPRCSLYLAKMYFDKGHYVETSKMLEHCKFLSAHIFSSSQIGRIYILSALCGIALYYLEESNLNDFEREERAKRIYSDYKAASRTKERTSKEFNELMILIDVFSEKSGTSVYEL